MVKRIQLSRKRGAKLPPGTVNAARPGRWGNPFNWKEYAESMSIEESKKCASGLYKDWLQSKIPLFEIERRRWILSHLHLIREAEYVACWCKATDSCHADILIELAMAEAIETSQADNNLTAS